MTRKKLVNSVVQSERRYLWREKGRLLAVYDGSGALKEQYVYATGSHTPDAVVIDNTTLYRIVQDHLGSVRLVLKASDGSLAQRVDYDAWGKINTATQVGAGFQAFGYAGGLPDMDTGLVQMGARWYDPVTGRWISKDPVRFDGGYNLYAYANNDPVSFVDVTGTDPTAPPFPFPWLPPLPGWLPWALPAAPALGLCIGAAMLMTGDAPLDRDDTIKAPPREKTKIERCHAKAEQVYNDCMKLEGDTFKCLESKEKAFNRCMGAI